VGQPEERQEVFAIGQDDGLWLTEQASPGSSTWTT